MALQDDIDRIRKIGGGLHMDLATCRCQSCAAQRVANAAEAWGAILHLLKSEHRYTESIGHCVDTIEELVAVYRAVGYRTEGE
jgi:NAD(P)H-nitrite reductase large subunit